MDQITLRMGRLWAERATESQIAGTVRAMLKEGLACTAAQASVANRLAEALADHLKWTAHVHESIAALALERAHRVDVIDRWSSFQDSGATMEALERAIEVAGGVSILAGRIGVSASAPSMWKSRKRVPAEYCPAIERETGVRCEDLRPDVAWDVLRLQASPAEPAQEAA